MKAKIGDAILWLLEAVLWGGAVLFWTMAALLYLVMMIVTAPLWILERRGRA